MKTWIGIDVSKNTLDVGWTIKEKRFHIKVLNETKGFKQILKKCPTNSHFVMESTGAYYLRLAFFLSNQNPNISVVNPLSVKRFSQMKLRRVKTDKADSFLIAL